MFMQRTSTTVKTVLISVICSFFVSSIVGLALYYKIMQKPTEDQLIRDFYNIENAVYVSPHGLRKSMDKGEQHYTIVDLRSQQEYEKEHVVGAVNIPAYSDPDTSAYGDVGRIVAAFKKLPKDKEVVVYCYSMPCMTGRKIGKMLTEHGIYVKHLGIGWNEWRYYWNLWNHELEWDQTKVEDYVVTGKEPGKPKKKSTNPLAPCSLDNTFGC